MPARNELQDNRPLSPHLQIYDLPLTAKLSILHRITGVILFLGMILTVWVLVVATRGADNWHNLHAFLSSGWGKTLLFGFIFALFYHLCCGIRHLVWDLGIGFSSGITHKSNLIILLSSITLSLLTWLFANVL